MTFHDLEWQVEVLVLNMVNATIVARCYATLYKLFYHFESNIPLSFSLVSSFFFHLFPRGNGSQIQLST